MTNFERKENSRPAGTGTTAKKCEIDKASHKDYTTKIKEMQVVIAIFAIIVLFFISVLTYLDTRYEFVPVDHKVTYGETLWTIAKDYKPENMSMGEYMGWVYEHNDGGYIYPGDVVVMAEVVR